MAKQLSFNFKKRGKAGRTTKGRIRKGYYLSCTGTMKKARKKRGKK